MSSLKTSLLAALVSAVATAGCLSILHHRRAEEVAGLRRANSQMRVQATQRRPAQTSLADAGVTSARAEVSTSPAPGGDYRNEGNATPLATLQTFAWACDRGDTDTVARLICLDAEAREKIEKHIAALPGDARAEWTSPEAMATDLITLANIQLPFPSARILEAATIEPISGDRVRLRLPGTFKDGVEYQKIDDGWRYVVTKAMVDKYIAQAAGKPAPAR